MPIPKQNTTELHKVDINVQTQKRLFPNVYIFYFLHVIYFYCKNGSYYNKFRSSLKMGTTGC